MAATRAEGGPGRPSGPALPSIRYASATALFLLALLTKTVTATLPAALLVVFWWQGRLRRDTAKSIVLPLLPWLAAGLLAGLGTAYVERQYLGAEGAAFALNALERCLLAGRVVGFYLGKLLWPANLIFIYPHWTVSDAAPGQYAYPALVLALFGLLWAVRGRWPGLLAAFLLYVGTLFPALGFVNVFPFQFSYVADHFQYLATLGPLALAGAGLDRLAGNEGRRALAFAGIGAAAAVLACLSWRQCRLYRSAEILYRDTLARNPGCWLMAYNLGVVLENSGRSQAAIDQYRDAERLNPDLALAYNNLGGLLANAGRLDDAVAQYRRALALDENEVRSARSLGRKGWYRAGEASVAYNLGNVYSKLGKGDDARSWYRRALRLNPEMSLAYAGLARSFSAAGEGGRSLRLYEDAVRANPASAEARNDFAVALHAAGRADEAAAQFEEALRLRPDFADAAFNLANIRREQHRLPEAIASYESALRSKPDSAEADVYLGASLAEAGRTAEASAAYDRARALRPSDPRLNYTLGLGLRDLNRYGEAIAAFQRALEGNPKFAEAENDLGIALAQSGRMAESLPHFEAALRLRPDFGEAENNLGLVLRAMGRTEEAKAKLDEAARLLHAPR